MENSFRHETPPPPQMANETILRSDPYSKLENIHDAIFYTSTIKTYLSAYLILDLYSKYQLTKLVLKYHLLYF